MIEFTEKQTQRIDEVCAITIEYLEKLLDQQISCKMREKLNRATIWSLVADTAINVLYDNGMYAHYPTHFCNEETGEEYIEEYYGMGV